MAPTITRANALAPVWEDLRLAASERAQGSGAKQVRVSVIGDSICSVPIVPDPRSHMKCKENTWVGQFINRLKYWAGDAGSLEPYRQYDEDYGGGHKSANSYNVHSLGRRRWAGGYDTRLGGGRRSLKDQAAWAQSTIDTSGTQMFGCAGACAKISAHPYSWSPWPVPFRYFDVHYPTDTSSIYDLTVTIDGVATVIDQTTTEATWGNVQTIDAGSYGMHQVTMVGAGAYSKVEAVTTRTGHSGVIDCNVSVSGNRWGYLAAYDTTAERMAYLGVTAPGDIGLCIIQLGYNDAASDSYSADSKAIITNAMTSWIDTLAGVPIMAVIPCINDGATDHSAFWTDVISTVDAAVADNSRLCWVNCYGTVSGWDTTANAVTNGYIPNLEVYRPWAPGELIYPGERIVPTNPVTDKYYYAQYPSNPCGADLAVDATNNKKVTSATYTFTSADVNCSLQVLTTGGGGAWTAASYNIDSVSSGAAILASSPAATSSTAGVFVVHRPIFSITGDTEPTWTGSSVSDNTVTWTYGGTKSSVADLTHPTLKGHEVWAEAVIAALNVDATMRAQRQGRLRRWIGF